LGAPRLGAEGGVGESQDAIPLGKTSKCYIWHFITASHPEANAFGRSAGYQSDDDDTRRSPQVLLC